MIILRSYERMILVLLVDNYDFLLIMITLINFTPQIITLSTLLN
jgi:hypothetical protein